jgi:MHS family alpha-ketoglutarate permease-like MFS transporter
MLLLVARLAQGLSVGGEYGTAATYMSEVSGRGQRGFYSSFQYVTLVGGQLLALVVLMILQNVLDLDQLKAWGWRIPFVIGAVAAIVAMYLRRSLQETAPRDALKHKEAGSILGLLPYKKSVLVTFGLTMGGSLYFYTFTTYMQKYLVNSAKMEPNAVSFVMTWALIIFMLLQPLFGHLSDRIGRKSNLLWFGAAGMIAAVPLLNLLGSATNTFTAFILLMTALLIGCFYTAISGVAKAELFPPEVRAVGVGLPYAIANAMFGGTAEYVALWMKSAGSEHLFAWYVAAIVSVALLSALWMPDTRKSGYLDGSGTV